MLKQNYISLTSSIIFFIVIVGLCVLSLNWADFKKIYEVKEVNIYGTTFFDQSEDKLLNHFVLATTINSITP